MGRGAFAGWRAWAVAALLALTGGAGSEALAQGLITSPPPIRSPVDANGVDLVTGALTVAMPSLSIGQGEGALSYSRQLIGGAWTDNLIGTVSTNGTTVTVSMGSTSESFTLTGGVYVNNQGGGSTLTAQAQTWTYTTAAGVVIVFNKALAASFPFGYGDGGRPVTATYPDGKVVTWTYQQVTVLGTSARRLQSVTNNLGYQIKFTYQLDNPVSPADLAGWTTIKSATGINNAVDWCDPAANTCSGFTQSWPSVSWSASPASSATVTVTDVMGQTSQFGYNPQGNLASIQRPGATAPTTTITYDGSNRVATVNNSAAVVGPTGSGPGLWRYAYTDVGSTRTTVATDPLGHARTVVSNTTTSLVSSDTDALNRTTSYLYDSFGRLTQVTRPETDYTVLAYDARGNLTTTTRYPNNGPGHGSIVTSASYDATCSAPAKCNQPNYTIDGNGNRTDYTYDSVRGVTLTVTAPPPTTGATRPQTRLGYSLLYAWFKNSAGSIVQAPSPVYLLTGTSACQTLSSCTGTADEVVTSLTYGASGIANNLGLTAASAGPGNGAALTSASQTYDVFGNIASTVGPLGASQTSVAFHNAARQVTGAIAARPAGKTNYLASRITYSPNGQPTLIERGTTTSQADLSTFVSLQQRAIAYDPLGRKIQESLSAGGTTLQLVQTTFDAVGNLACTAVRMNPAAFAAPPASACVLGTAGSYGPDLITTNAYDAANQLTKVTTAALATQQADYATMTYGANGEVLTVKDAKGNLTTTVYDNYDRVSQTQYPSPTTPGVSNTADYEAFTWDANSNPLTVRRRSGETITLTYDALNRLTLKHFPAGTQQDVYLAYDLLGRGLYAHYGSTSGPGVDSAYDALGRVTSTTASSRTLAYQYDAASNRTRITWPDGYYAAYVYDVLNRVTAVEENGATSGAGLLASYAYDDLGRRTGITRAGGSGAATSYGWDGADRLSSLAHDLAGAANDVTWGFTYNPASQIGPRTSTNDAYGYHPPAQSLPATINGLNQIATLAETAFSYDVRGNETANGSNTFSYDLENHFTGLALPTAATYAYDPAGRMQTATVGGTASTFLYDGANLVAEYDSSGTLNARHVFGPGVDEPIVSYAGSGTTSRSFLLADNTGSIVAATDASGALTAQIGYSPTGEPSTWTGPRFAFTGQAILPGSHLFNFKARIYDPVPGRFLQTDPIGVASDINLYAYAGSDPVNASDPSGMAECSSENYQFCTSTNVSDVTVAGHHVDEPTYININMITGPPGSLAGGVGITNFQFDAPGTQRPQSNSACNNAAAVAFVNAHSAESAQVARALNVPVANVLGLSAAETQYGVGRFAVQGNNFFSLHAGPNIPYATGSMPSARDGPMATFSSYLSSAQAFGARYGGAVSGISDPTAFAQALVGAGFNSGSAATGGRNGFVAYTAGIIGMTGRRISCPR